MRQNESNLTMTTDVAVTTNTTNMEEKGMKGFFKNMKKKVLPAVAGSVTGAMLMTSTCFAAGTGTTAVTQPLENLKTLVIAVIGAVGVIILAKNVMEFAQAYQQQDSSTMNSALKGIVSLKRYLTICVPTQQVPEVKPLKMRMVQPLHRLYCMSM